ncbi:MAG: cellulose biosynthesis cyclic di-GMP-binding regulatory protein BcsB [Chitinophagaceae bacterium]
MKSKILSLVVAILCVAASSFAQAGDARTFKAMGYDDASIQGITGSLSYFLKVNPDENIDASSVVLNIRASQVLNPNNSFIVVYLKDEPVFTQRVIASALDTLMTFSVKLSSKYLQPDGRFIKLRIAAKMSIGDEYCKDVDNPACWIAVRNSSYITKVTSGALAFQRSVKELIQEYASVYTPQVSSEDDLQAGGLIYAILRQSASSKEVYTGTYGMDTALPRGILVGEQSKLPAIVKQNMPSVSAGQGMIALVPVNNGFGEKRFVLVITGGDASGFRKAVNILASNKRLSSAFTEKLIIQTAEPSSVSLENPSPLVTSLEDLGGDPGLMEGIGALRKKYNFSLTEFNAIPNKLTFHIESYFSTLKTDDRGFINVYLNQNLVYNASLSDKPNFISDIDLKPYLLSKFNTIEVEFRFHPGANICKDGFSNFFAFVNTKMSTLTFAGERENKFYSFFNFPAEFRKTPTKLFVSPGLLSQNVVSSIGEIYYQLNSPIKNNYNKLIVPKVTSNTNEDFAGYNVIALVQKGDAFAGKFSNKPVNFEQNFQLYKDVQGKMNYSVSDFSNSGLAQIFREKGSTVLMVTALGDSTAKDAYLSVIKNFSTQLTEIESNVCIANSGGLSNYFFKAPEENTVVSYKGETSAFQRFMDNYKYWIMGILLILILLGYFAVKSRVKKATDAVI